MPHASPQVAEDRGQEILASIRQVFAEKGFDGASMQELARGAGMSVGNFYRYFPSKAAIVQAMCGLDMAEIQRDFAEVQTSDTPMQRLRDRIRAHLSEDDTSNGQLWAEVTAASVRKPEIGAVAAQMEAGITDLLSSVFARTTRRNIDAARQRYEGQCQMLILLVKGVATRTAQFGPANPALTNQVMRIVDMILNEIANDVAEG